MSQGRMQKAAPLANNLNGARTKVPITKAADDSLVRNHRHGHHNPRSSVKNKIPKSVRYDLENALVGLCDVWFEEIKPHLVRNNIKLHIHGTASGDHKQQDEPASTCSHHDPGAAPDLPQRTNARYASSCLMPRTASRAQSVKPPAHSHLKNPLLQRPTTTLSLREVQNLHLVCEDTRAQRPIKSRHKKRRSSQREAHLNWRVPRLCRTYGTVPSAVTQLSKSSVINNNYPQCAPPQRHQKNKSTQTELSIPSGHVLSVSTQTYSQYARTCSPLTAMGSRLINKQEKTTLISSPLPYCKNCTGNKEPVLFQNDLLDIISEKHDKRLKVIYNNPEQVEYPSLIYLMSPKKPKKSRSPKMMPPWR